MPLMMGWLEVLLLDSLETPLPLCLEKCGEWDAVLPTSVQDVRYVFEAAFPSMSNIYKIRKTLLDHLQERIWLC